jgi:N-acetylglucosaminyldiphosphoundecaprenol N-acetyl-beta-D-mannosaminyltransferase
MTKDTIYYDSYKEDRDLVLEYNQVTLENATVVNLTGVGVDNLSRNQAVVKVMRMIEQGGTYHILSLNPYKIQRIKSNSDLRTISSKADLHLACGAGLQWAAKMMRTPLKERISLLSFMMDLVRIAEIKEYTIFFVGARPEITEKAFSNIRKSFPKIRIVGRHGGYFNAEREKSVIEAMRKSEANIVFIGLGFPKEDKWIHSIRGEFKNTVFISVGGSIDILSGDIRKAPPYFMDRGMDWFYRIITKPWRAGRLLRVAAFFLMAIIKRIFSGKK